MWNNGEYLSSMACQHRKNGVESWQVVRTRSCVVPFFARLDESKERYSIFEKLHEKQYIIIANVHKYMATC